MSNFLDSEDEEGGKHDIYIEIESTKDVDLDLAPIPNQKPKWDQMLIKLVGDVVGDPNDRRKTRS